MKAVLALLLTSVITSNTAFANSKNRLFDEVEITTNLVLSQPVKPIDLLPNPGKELVLIGTNDQRQYLDVFAVSDGNLYNRIKRIEIPEYIHGIDFTNHKVGRQAVYFMSSDAIYKLNLIGSSSIEHVTDINTYLKKDKSKHLSSVNFVQSINNDGKADFLTTDFNASYVYVSDENSYYTTKVELPARISLEGMRAEVMPPRFDLFDSNEDGISEIVAIDNGELTLFPHLSATVEQREKIALRSDIMADDWWEQQGEDGGSLDQSNLVYRKLETIKDINNDGILDLVVRFTKSSGALDRRNDYEIYLGAIEKGKIVFDKATNSVIKDDSTLTDLRFVDVDQDNKYEVLVSGFDIGVSQIVGALLSGSISQDVHLFYMDNMGNFNEDDRVTREVELSFSLSSGRSGSPVVLFADVNGDGKKDWVLSDEQEAFKVYMAKSNSSFSRKATKYKTTLPTLGTRVVSGDFNQDGYDDLLMSYGRLDDEKMRQTIKILFARKG